MAEFEMISGAVNPKTQTTSAGPTVSDAENKIEQASAKVESAEKAGAVRQATQKGEELSQFLGRFGGGAFKTGAAAKAFGDIATQIDTQVQEIVERSALARERLLLSQEQFIQNLKAEGVLDPSTGAFLQSRFSMRQELDDVRFRRAVEESRKVTEENAETELIGDLAKLGTEFFFPQISAADTAIDFSSEFS